jgi:CheY-like chemotaxis protein
MAGTLALEIDQQSDLDRVFSHGGEMGARMRELGSAAVDLHLVAVTGYGQPADRERSAAAGFARHVVKPVDLSRLQRVVEDLPEPA